MTKALFSGVLAGLFAMLALGQAVRADEARKAAAAKPTPQTFVVLVGISEYADKQIKPRPNAEADVKALYKMFTSKDYLGAEASHVRLLVGKTDDAEQKATRANFLKSIKWVADEAKPDDTVLIAFIGHGGPLGESGDSRCYFLADSTFKGRSKDAVTPEEIEEPLKKLKAKHLAVFLDVDFKGFVDDGKSRAIAEPTLGKAPYKEWAGDDGTDDHLPLPGRVVFLATNGLAPSLDVGDHGIFTKVLLEGMQGKADTEGYEADGLITVDELVRYMNKRLPELARKHGKTEKEKEQDHFVLAGPGTHFILTHNPAAIEANRKRLAKLAEELKSGAVPHKYAEEARTLLERMPPLKKKQELRKAYQELVDGKVNVDKFDEKRTSILESMQLKRTESLSFARKVLEAIEVIQEEYVKEVNPGQMVAWGIRDLYTFVEEKVPAKVEAQLKTARSMRAVQLLSLLADARKGLGQREDLDNQKDLTITLQRMLHRLDPHTTYIDPETKKRFDQDIEMRFTGIGVHIRKDLATDQLLVVTPIKGSPAYKAKLMAGDLITQIIRDVDEKGNPIKPPQIIPTRGMPINKAVKLIQGQADTDVKLTIQREGVEKPFDVVITRASIEVESVLGARRKANDDWDFMIDRKNKIGYIRLSSFARNSARDMKAVMADLLKQGIQGFVLDLRFNPGGLLNVAIDITDLYIDDGLIVSIRPRGGQAREARFNGRHDGSLLDFPMVCLVNGYSASGSEIVSAALQDHKRALIIGERSYGKGSVQNIRDFEVIDPKSGEILKAEIKLTTASFWRPNGKNLNKASTPGKDEDEWGVTPDKVIKLSPKERRDLAEHQRNLETIERPDRRGKVSNNYKDRQLEAALEYLRGQIKMASRGTARKAG
jgi:C-terminal peptidase prc